MKSLIVFTALIAITAAGCTNVSGGAYRQAEVGRQQQVDFGTVLAVRPVLIEGTQDDVPIGTIAGAVVGGALGSSLGGRSSTRLLGGVAGGVAGGLAGRAIQGQVSQQQGLEITVELDRGRVVAVTQGADQSFRVGDRVRVLSTPGGRTRVTL